MRPIVLNSTNLIDDGYQNKYKFKFTPNFQVSSGDAIAVASINMYYSWFNITDSSTGGKYNNNVFQYIWPYTSSGTINTTATTVTITPGYYTATTLNTFLQNVMIKNGHYLVDSTGNYLYYIQIAENATYYSIEFQYYVVPNTIGTNTLPTNSVGSTTWAFPGAATTAIAPRIYIPSDNNFGALIGYTGGITYPTTGASSSNTSTISDITPQLSPVSCILVNCNLVANPYTIPRGLIYAFTPANTDFGGMITSVPPFESFVPLSVGSHQELIIEFKDQNNNDIAIGDSNLVIILNIKSKTE